MEFSEQTVNPARIRLTQF